MRKIIVSMNVTLDSYIAGPNNELDWHFAYWTEEMADWLGSQLTGTDTLLLGHKTYRAMAEYWPMQTCAINTNRGDLAFAGIMNAYKKVVIARKSIPLPWHNSLLIKDNWVAGVTALKQRAGKDIIVLGSGQLVKGLINTRLIDEFILWVHPVTLGRGRPLFNGLNHTLAMRLINTKVFRSGVVALQYAAR
jgi:dihydrofolate reductase